MEKELSVSMSCDSPALEHNRRAYTPKNVTLDKMNDNIYIKTCENLEKEFNEIFEKSVEEYNSKQTRNDRKKLNYFKEIDSKKDGAKSPKPCYEYVFQFGDMYNNNVNNPQFAQTVSDTTKMLQAFEKMFEKKYPNLKVISATIHRDEQTPHLHLDFVPTATGYKKGMKMQCSLTKALSNLGFNNTTESDMITGKSKRTLALTHWQNDVKNLMVEVMSSYGYSREFKNNTEKHLSIDKKKQATENSILIEKENSIKESIEALTETRDKTALQLVSDFVTGKGRDKVETAEKIIENETVLQDAMRRENEERSLELEKRESIVKYRETKAYEKIEEINKQIVVNNKNTAILKNGWAKLQTTVEQETQKRLSSKTFRASHANEDERYKQRCKLNFSKEYEQEINKSSEHIQQTHEKIERLKHHTSKRKQKGVCLE